MAGAIAAQVVGGLVTQLSPFVIAGVMSGFSLSEREAGFVASVEFLTLAVTAIVMAPLLPRLSYRRAGLCAVVLTLATQAASLMSASWVSFVLLRGLAGLGEGALYALSLSVVACRCRNPDKVYGYFQVVWALGSVALFAAGGELTAAFAQRGVVGLILGVTLASTPLLFLIPNARDPGGHAASAQAAPSSALSGLMTLAATFLYLTVSAALYMFSGPLGERAGLGTSAVGYALTVSSLLGLGGAAAATAINVRWGRLLPITAFCLAFAGVALVLCLAHRPAPYVLALVGSCVVFYFSIPYLLGLAAALDPSGRWAAAAGSAYLLGFAAGPVVGGVVIAGAGYVGLAAVCVVATAMTWGLALLVARRLNVNPPPQAG